MLLILLRFLPYIAIFCLGFYLKGCQTDKLITDLKNQVIKNQEKIIITERKLNDYNNNVVTQTFDFIEKNDEIYNNAYKFDFSGLYQRADGTEVPNPESSTSSSKKTDCKSSDKFRAEYNGCISELEGLYKKELEKSKKCDEITIKYNSLIDVINNFLRVQQDAEKNNTKNYPN